jgi:hypothetical protein
MPATRRSNIEKRFDYVADGDKPVVDEEEGLVTKPVFIMLKIARYALPFAVAMWSVLELPLELFLTQSPTERLASVAGRLIWVGFAFGAMCNTRFARAIFFFLCAVSSIVVAQALPMAYEASPVVFGTLVVDVVLKLSALVASLISSLMTPHSHR